jgi:hypothetical protein
MIRCITEATDTLNKSPKNIVMFDAALQPAGISSLQSSGNCYCHGNPGKNTALQNFDNCYCHGTRTVA